MSFKKKMLSECVQQYRKEFKETKDRMERKASLFEMLEKETGLDFINDAWDLRFHGNGNSLNSLEVSLEDIHGIKQVVGPFEKVFSKTLCQDYDETGEIWITCYVKEGVYKGWRFRYRHWLSPDEDCKVEEVKIPKRTSPESSYKALRCERKTLSDFDPEPLPKD